MNKQSQNEQLRQKHKQEKQRISYPRMKTLAEVKIHKDLLEHIIRIHDSKLSMTLSRYIMKENCSPNVDKRLLWSCIYHEADHEVNHFALAHVPADAEVHHKNSLKVASNLGVVFCLSNQPPPVLKSSQTKICDQCCIHSLVIMNNSSIIFHFSF